MLELIGPFLLFLGIFGVFWFLYIHTRQTTQMRSNAFHSGCQHEKSKGVCVEGTPFVQCRDCGAMFAILALW
jgi:hypothetical protein